MSDALKKMVDAAVAKGVAELDRRDRKREKAARRMIDEVRRGLTELRKNDAERDRRVDELRKSIDGLKRDDSLQKLAPIWPQATHDAPARLQ